MNAIKCAVCLESHVPRKMNVNVGCGHVSICNGCIENDETIQRHGRTDEQNVYQGWWHGNCPICRTPGNFINIYLPFHFKVSQKVGYDTFAASGFSISILFLETKLAIPKVIANL